MEALNRHSSMNRRTLVASGVGIMGFAGTVHLAAPAFSQNSASGQASTGEVSVLEWGVKGGNDAGDTERIQQALDEAPIGCNLVFPTGYFRIRRQLQVNRRLNLISRGAILSANLMDHEDVFSINIEDEGNRDNRNMIISGFRIIVNSGGRNCIHIQNASPNLSNIGMLIENNILGVRDVSTGFAIAMQGIGTHFNVIRNCQLENGVLLSCADGTVVEQCLIFGKKTAITLDLIEGAFQTKIINNGLVSRDGAMLVRNGSQVLFSGNQVEQFPTSGRNQSQARSSIAIMAADRGVRHVRILGNNFGGGANVENSITVEGNCQDIFIDDNVFCTTSSGTDISLNGRLVAWSRIGPNNTVRGPVPPNVRKRVNPVVKDTGLGTFGVRKYAADLAERAPQWIANSEFCFWKSLDGVVRLQGAWSPGATKSGTLIAFLPEGFRPSASAFLHCATDATEETAVLRIDSDGAIRVHRSPKATIYLSGTSFPAADRAAYPPTDP